MAHNDRRQAARRRRQQEGEKLILSFPGPKLCPPSIKKPPVSKAAVPMPLVPPRMNDAGDLAHRERLVIKLTKSLSRGNAQLRSAAQAHMHPVSAADGEARPAQIQVLLHGSGRSQSAICVLSLLPPDPRISPPPAICSAHPERCPRRRPRDRCCPLNRSGSDAIGKASGSQPVAHPGSCCRERSP